MSAPPRPVNVVLGEALAELREREARLDRLEEELAQTRAAIKALRKLLGDRRPLALSPGAPPARSQTSPTFPEKDCSLCGKPFQPTGPRSVYCAGCKAEREQRDGGSTRGAPGELKAAAIAAVKGSLDPLSREQIAEQIGRDGRGLSIVLGAAISTGELILINGCYGTPAPGASAEELAEANASLT